MCEETSTWPSDEAIHDSVSVTSVRSLPWRVPGGHVVVVLVPWTFNPCIVRSPRSWVRMERLFGGVSTGSNSSTFREPDRDSDTGIVFI